MYDSLSSGVFLRMGILGAGLVFQITVAVGAAALFLTQAVVLGAETADGRLAQKAELDGIVLGMGKGATSLQWPYVSGTLAGSITLVRTSLVDTKGQSLQTESESGCFPSCPSDYKTSYYSPNISLSGANAQWTWSLTFVANEDISLSQTQVAFFSCDKSFLDKSSKATDFTILYTLGINDGENSLASFQGKATLSGAEGVSVAGYDFANGEITSGSGAMVTVDWSDAVLLKQGLTYTYYMTVAGAEQAMAESTGIGFSAIHLRTKSIPEPTPAALFQLCVAFSILRRRRVSRV